MRRSGAEKAAWMRQQFEIERAAAQPAVDIKLHTRVPSKWLIIDLETGEVYRASRNDDGTASLNRLDWKLFERSYGPVSLLPQMPLAKASRRVKNGIRRPQAKAKGRDERRTARRDPAGKR